MTAANDFDVLIVGAGLSGISGAVHLQKECPTKRFAILEGRSEIGGTWSIFKYPGIRSDSDMHTLGFRFKPWIHEKSIADGPSIMDYLKETVEGYDLGDKIHYNRKVTKADWSSEQARWIITAEITQSGDTETYTANFLFMCSGYYSYKGGHRPDFPGEQSFKGEIIHPQQWPEDLDYSGKNVVIVGSGATAMTLVPAMTDKAAHVTMLQRSPTYVVSRPARDGIANAMRSVLPERLAYKMTRWKNVTLQNLFYKRARTKPEKMKDTLLGLARKQIGDELVEHHFTPSYNPWDQRLCLVPDSDLFNAINAGKASVVTDHIETFTETGIQLKSGKTLQADLIITATGLKLVVLGEAQFSIDGAPVDFSKTWTYKGMGYSDVPNMITTFGYINASWTLRADLTSEYVCRLINHMDKTGTRQCSPRLRPEDQNMPAREWITDFPAGYMNRAMHLFPKQGDKEPWLNPQDYMRDKKLFRERPVDDGVMLFENQVPEPLVANDDAPALGAAE